MKNKFLQIAMGTSMLFITAGFFVRSFNTVQAAPAPEKFLQANSNSIGKYMILQLPVHTGDGTAGFGRLLVLDTETGKSKIYRWGGGQVVCGSL